MKLAVEVASVISRQCRGFQAERFEEAVQLGKAVDGCATVIAAGDVQIMAKDLTKRYIFSTSHGISEKIV